MVDVTKREQVEALAKEHDRVDVLFNVAGCMFRLCFSVSSSRYHHGDLKKKKRQTKTFNDNKPDQT